MIEKLSVRFLILAIAFVLLLMALKHESAADRFEKTHLNRAMHLHEIEDYHYIPCRKKMTETDRKRYNLIELHTFDCHADRVSSQY